jgi:hypothetical protein
LETKIAKGIVIKAIIKLTDNSFHVAPILSRVKFSINVPITSAGIKIVFSSFDKTAAEFSGNTLILTSMNPITINPKRKAV